MRRRVAQRLAAWALLDEAELVATLTRLEERPPDAARLRRARTLFAHALDTPGGLKVVTIHAFCESVLHRFPVEAGVPFDFTVTEEAEATRMILAAREATLAAGINGDPGLAGPVETLFDLLSDYSISEAIDSALAEGHRLRPLLGDVPEPSRGGCAGWSGTTGAAASTFRRKSSGSGSSGRPRSPQSSRSARQRGPPPSRPNWRRCRPRIRSRRSGWGRS